MEEILSGSKLIWKLCMSDWHLALKVMYFAHNKGNGLLKALKARFCSIEITPAESVFMSTVCVFFIHKCQ